MKRLMASVSLFAVSGKNSSGATPEVLRPTFSGTST